MFNRIIYNSFYNAIIPREKKKDSTILLLLLLLFPEGRLRTLKILRVLSVVHVISGLLLLVLVVVAQSTHGPVKADAPPYYVGAIITLVMVREIKRYIKKPKQ